MVPNRFLLGTYKSTLVIRTSWREEADQYKWLQMLVSHSPITAHSLCWLSASAFFLKSPRRYYNALVHNKSHYVLFGTLALRSWKEGEVNGEQGKAFYSPTHLLSLPSLSRPKIPLLFFPSSPPHKMMRREETQGRELVFVMMSVLLSLFPLCKVFLLSSISKLNVCKFLNWIYIVIERLVTRVLAAFLKMSVLPHYHRLFFEFLHCSLQYFDAN